MSLSDSPRAKTPTPAYLPTSPTSPLHTPRALYSAISSAPRLLTYSHTIPIRTGHAWSVPAGHICRLSTPEGAQVGDLNIWNLHNPRERFWAARTRQLHASHVTTFDRLWSCLPYLRPLVTIVGDTLSGYGVDGVGGRCHDLLGTRCDPYVNQMLTGLSFDYHCHSNLTRAILPYGLAESDVHDVLNVFQVTGLNKNGQYFMEPSPAKPGDYFEFFAEIDILCALSTCPGGDLSAWQFGEAEPNIEPQPSHEAGPYDEEHPSGEAVPRRVEMVDTCRPIYVDVFKILDETVLADWKPPSPPAYTGMHGLGMPVFQQKRESTLREKGSEGEVESSPGAERSRVEQASQISPTA